MQRRTFVTASLAASSTAWAGANDRIRAAVVGTGGRGLNHVSNILRASNTEIAAVCDPDSARMAKAASIILEKTGKRPKEIADVRKVLEDKSIDAVSIASCNHWHALGTVWACQAGKHVLVEKPLCHNFEEGRKMVEAARKYGRIVQGGTQRRSSGGYRKAIQLLHEGIIGDIYLSRWLLIGQRNSIGHQPNTPPPSHLAWDLWLGPAPQQAHHANLVHYNWHWFWDFGGGEMLNNGVHSYDISRWAMRKGMPTRTSSTGGRFAWNDQGQTPNTQTATFDFEDGTQIVGELRNHYTANDERAWFFYGTKGAMKIVDGGPGAPDNIKGVYQVYLNGSKTPEPDMGRLDDIDHHANFFDAIRQGKREILTDDVEELHLSTAPCLFANISYRLRRDVRFDAKAQRFAGDAEADAMLGRAGRAPYAMPAKV